MAQKRKEKKEKQKEKFPEYSKRNGKTRGTYNEYESSEFQPQSEFEEREQEREYPRAFESEEERGIRYRGGRRYEGPYKEYRSSEYGEIPTEEYESGRAYEGERGFGEKEYLESGRFSSRAEYEAEKAGYERGYEAAMREHSTKHEEDYPKVRDSGRYRGMQAGYTSEPGWNPERERRGRYYAGETPRGRNRERSWEKPGKLGARKTERQQEQEF